MHVFARMHNQFPALFDSIIFHCIVQVLLFIALISKLNSTKAKSIRIYRLFFYIGWHGMANEFQYTTLTHCFNVLLSSSVCIINGE